MNTRTISVQELCRELHRKEKDPVNQPPRGNEKGLRCRWAERVCLQFPAAPAECRGHMCQMPPLCRRSGLPPDGMEQMDPSRKTSHTPRSGHSGAFLPAWQFAHRLRHGPPEFDGPPHKSVKKCCSFFPDFVQVHAAALEDWQLGPDGVYPRQIQIRIEGGFLCTGPAETSRPGIHGNGVAIG